MLDKFKLESILCVFVPANCTDRLQPLDVCVNKPLKDHMKQSFVAWYSDKVSCHLSSGGTVDTMVVGLQNSVLKALAAQWLLDAFDYCAYHLDIGKEFRSVGIDFSL